MNSYVTRHINELVAHSGLRYCSKGDHLQPIDRFYAKGRYCKACQTLYERSQPARKIREAKKKRERVARLRINGSHTQAQWEAVLIQYGYACLACGSRGNIQKDHVVPIAMHGTDNIDNLQPLCATCNNKKGATYIDYRS